MASDSGNTARPRRFRVLKRKRNLMLGLPILGIIYMHFLLGERTCTDGEQYLVSAPFAVIHSQSNVYSKLIITFKPDYMESSSSKVLITAGALCDWEPYIRIPWGEKPALKSTDFDVYTPQNLSLCFKKNYSIVSVEPRMPEKPLENATYINIASIFMFRPNIKIIRNESNTVTFIHNTPPLDGIDELAAIEYKILTFLAALSSINYTGCVEEQHFIDGTSPLWLIRFQENVIELLLRTHYFFIDRVVPLLATLGAYMRPPWLMSIYQELIAMLSMAKYLLIDLVVMPPLMIVAVMMMYLVEDSSLWGAFIAWSFTRIFGSIILRTLGFTPAGIIARSFAARLMGLVYYTGYGLGVLATLQTAGATGKMCYTIQALSLIVGWLLGFGIEYYVVWSKI